jgi:hypothetical protein
MELHQGFKQYPHHLQLEDSPGCVKVTHYGPHGGSGHSGGSSSSIDTLLVVFVLTVTGKRGWPVPALLMIDSTTILPVLALLRRAGAEDQ